MQNDVSTPEGGIYSLYLTGSAGNGFGLIVLKDGIISGSDSNGTLFDGNYIASESFYHGKITVKTPMGGGNLIQGIAIPAQGLTYEVDFKLPSNFSDLPYVRLPTPFGDLNVKFVRLRVL